jgi:hypothetical protein
MNRIESGIGWNPAIWNRSNGRLSLFSEKIKLAIFAQRTEKGK